MGHERRASKMCAAGGLALVAMLVLSSLPVPSASAAPVPIDERTIPLKPGTTFVHVGFLTGEFDDLRVTEHVERATGRRVGIPLLRGMLTLRDASLHRAAHLLAGKIEYLNAEGKPIPIPPAEGDTTLQFIGTAADRLDPGQEVTVSIAVPYPAAALTRDRIREVRLALTYTSTPYRRDTARFPVVVSK